MKKDDNKINPKQGKGIPQPHPTSDRKHTDVKKIINQGVPNAGGQTANQTDNKQSTVNKGNQSPNKRGKEN